MLRHTYLPITAIQKCKTTRNLTYKQSDKNATKQSTMFIKYSLFGNQLWKTPEVASIETIAEKVYTKIRY